MTKVIIEGFEDIEEATAFAKWYKEVGCYGVMFRMNDKDVDSKFVKRYNVTTMKVDTYSDEITLRIEK